MKWCSLNQAWSYPRASDSAMRSRWSRYSDSHGTRAKSGFRNGHSSPNRRLICLAFQGYRSLRAESHRAVHGLPEGLVGLVGEEPDLVVLVAEREHFRAGIDTDPVGVTPELVDYDLHHASLRVDSLAHVRTSRRAMARMCSRSYVSAISGCF